MLRKKCWGYHDAHSYLLGIVVVALLGSGVLRAQEQSSQSSTTTTTSGTITTIGQTVTMGLPAGASTVAVQVTGTWTGELDFETTVDNSTWVVHPLTSTAAGPVTGVATNGIWEGSVGALQQFRVLAASAMTGSASVTMVASTGLHVVELDSSIPAGTNFIGNVGITGSFPVITITPPDVQLYDFASHGIGSTATTGLGLDNHNLWNVVRDAAGNDRGANVSATNALKVDGSAVTQPVSGSVTVSGAVSVSNAAGASAVNIQDGGNSITVDGTVALSAGSAVIGHVIVDTAPSTVVTQGTAANLNVTEASAAAIKAKTDNLDVALSTRLKPADTLTGVTTVGTVSAVTAITNALPAGSNVIGHVITDTGSTTAVTGTVATSIAGTVTTSGGGTVGSPAPTTAVQIGTQDGNGNLTPVQAPMGQLQVLIVNTTALRLACNALRRMNCN